MEPNSSLKAAIKNNKLVIFAGSGTSINIGLPDWKKLAIEIFSEIAKDNGNLRPVIELIKNNTFDPLSAFNLIENKKGEVLDILKHQLTISKDLDFSLHKKIMNLSPQIITTNYDKAFEFSDTEQSDVILYDSSYQLSRLSKKNHFIFKIHGDIDSPDKCILFKSDYEDLYGHDSAFLLEMKKILTDKTILFLGFSMSDPYVLNIFKSLTNLYHGYNNKHFLITTDNRFDVAQLEHKIELIILKSYDDLNHTLDDLISFKTEQIKVGNYLQKKIEEFDTLTEFTILCADPIDKNFDIKQEYLISHLFKYKIGLENYYLSIDKLNTLLHTDYVFLLTKLAKNKFTIEDDYLTSLQLSLSEIDSNIATNEIKCVIILYEGDIYVPEASIELHRPYVLINMKRETLKDIIVKFLYHFLTKHELAIIPNILVFNKENIEYPKISRGACFRRKTNPKISKFLDPKISSRFVGRKTDLESLTRKIVDLQFDNRILSVKGSGGIGKTTLITKVSIEIAERGYYNKGVFFIQCQAITSFENFQYEVSQCFDLTSSSKLEEQIQENFSEKDRLIILDNFETVLNILESESVLTFMAFICDYASVVLTTRQKTGQDFEDIFEVRNLTTDEGIQLFKNLYPSVKPADEVILREKIIEQILNNNPLAIKLIANGLPTNKDLKVLYKELEDNVFKDENIEMIFERPEDLNIERSKSLYHSINYSYQKLSETEKFTFEILSIFPDGISLENFKTFSKSSNKAKFKVTDRDIKSLDDKSLLENSNNFLRLQSIISRFSEHQFHKQDDEVKNEFFTLAFDYNLFLSQILGDNRYVKSIHSLRLLDMHHNNFLKVLDYIKSVDASFEKRLDFIDDITNTFMLTNQIDTFIVKLQNLHDYFSVAPFGKLALQVIEIQCVYWVKYFEVSYENLISILPFDELQNLDIEDLTQKNILINATTIYDCEGLTKEIITLSIDKDFTTHRLDFKLFKLGKFSLVEKIHTNVKREPDFAVWESRYITGNISADELKEHIKKIYSKDSLEITQSYYCLSKIETIPESVVKKLIVSNPYTEGLIKLMEIKYAESQNIYEMYVYALTKLFHIKYYYVEGLYQFCVYLKDIDSPEFNKWYTEGYELAIKFSFCHKIYLFETLLKEEVVIYDEDWYTEKYLSISQGLNELVNSYIRRRKNN